MKRSGKSNTKKMQTSRALKKHARKKKIKEISAYFVAARASLVIETAPATFSVLALDSNGIFRTWFKSNLSGQVQSSFDSLTIANHDVDMCYVNSWELYFFFPIYSKKAIF